MFVKIVRAGVADADFLRTKFKIHYMSALRAPRVIIVWFCQLIRALLNLLDAVFNFHASIRLCGSTLSMQENSSLTPMLIIQPSSCGMAPDEKTTLSLW